MMALHTYTLQLVLGLYLVLAVFSFGAQTYILSNKH